MDGSAREGELAGSERINAFHLKPKRASPSRTGKVNRPYQFSPAIDSLSSRATIRARVVGDNGEPLLLHRRQSSVGRAGLPHDRVR